MKFNLKTLVAAVALAGASVSANAGILAGNAASGGELWLYVYDGGAKASYIKDLGVTFNDFLATPAFNMNVAADGNWATYLGLVAGNLGNTRWGVVGNLQTATPNNANGSQLLTTAFANPPAQNNAQIAATAGLLNGAYLTDLADPTAANSNNSYVFDSNTVSLKNWGNVMTNSFNSNVTFSTANEIGVASDFYKLVRSTNRGTGVATETAILSPAGAPVTWNFNGSTLVAAAVPEPETYGMLLAGLGMIGAIVRRRRRA